MDIADASVPDELFANGLWVPAPEFGAGVAWQVRSTEVPAYQALLDRLLAELPIEKKLPVIDATERERIDNICIARVLLTGWKGWTDGGKPIPFSSEQALTWLTEPRFIRIRRSIRSAVNTVEMRGKTEAALEGNASAPPSAGS